MIRPQGASTLVTFAPHRSATSAMRVPKTPLTPTTTSSPGSMRFTKQNSMPALPVPLTGNVISFCVMKTERSIALISSIIFTKTGSRWPTSGIDMALRTLGATSLGPGPIRRRFGGVKADGVCIGKAYGTLFGLAMLFLPFGNACATGDGPNHRRFALTDLPKTAWALLDHEAGMIKSMNRISVRSALVLIGLLFHSTASIGTGAGDKLSISVTNKLGDVFSNLSVANILPDGLLLENRSGQVKVKFGDLPAEVRAKYEPLAAAAKEKQLRAAQANASYLASQKEVEAAREQVRLDRKKEQEAKQ